MTHARGRSPAKLDRAYPYQVEVIVPENGLGTRLIEMITFANKLDENIKQGRDLKTILPLETDSARFCFRTEENAVSFLEKYGGRLIIRGCDMRKRWDA